MCVGQKKVYFPIIYATQPTLYRSRKKLEFNARNHSAKTYNMFSQMETLKTYFKNKKAPNQKYDKHNDGLNILTVFSRQGVPSCK